MREILFKAKRLDGKGWVRGDLLQYLDGTCVIHWYDKGVRVSSEIDPSTVCQYTGLKDKNGVKIFDGDIITIKNPEPFSPWICKVIYRDCGFWLEGISRTAIVMLTDYTDVEMEVTGNIHD